MASTRSFWRLGGLAVLVVLAFVAGWLVARAGMGAAIDPATLPAVEQRFIEQMHGAALVGHFTVTGREGRAPTEDRYDLYGVDKVGEDLWRFNAKIGETGLTVPVVVRMTFVDDTPIILMSDVSIPGMATYSARVIFHGDLYAGTWSHAGAGGGHLFGRIERGKAR